MASSDSSDHDSHAAARAGRDAQQAVEAALAHTREDLRAYVHYLDAAIEQERAHIARELHDELGQRLTALKIDLRWLGGQYAERPELPASWTTRIDGMAQLIDETIHDLPEEKG